MLSMRKDSRLRKRKGPGVTARRLAAEGKYDTGLETFTWSTISEKDPRFLELLRKDSEKYEHWYNLDAFLSKVERMAKQIYDRFWQRATRKKPIQRFVLNLEEIVPYKDLGVAALHASYVLWEAKNLREAIASGHARNAALLAGHVGWHFKSMMIAHVGRAAKFGRGPLRGIRNATKASVKERKLRAADRRVTLAKKMKQIMDTGASRYEAARILQQREFLAAKNAALAGDTIKSPSHSTCYRSVSNHN